MNLLTKLLPGWKTLIVNAGIAFALWAVPYFASVNWTQYVSPTTAMYITLALNGVMRLMTNTPAFMAHPTDAQIVGKLQGTPPSTVAAIVQAAKVSCHPVTVLLACTSVMLMLGGCVTDGLQGTTLGAAIVSDIKSGAATVEANAAAVFPSACLLVTDAGVVFSETGDANAANITGQIATLCNNPPKSFASALVAVLALRASIKSSLATKPGAPVLPPVPAAVTAAARVS